MASVFKVSFVVDQNPVHYYQAELLLFSLEHFAMQKKEDIVVHCTSRVDAYFLDFLRVRGLSFQMIEPFLDGKYCNKVRQLDTFCQQHDMDGVFLLDTDVFVLEPLSPAHSDVFCGKIVDAENPPLRVIKNIFSAAGLQHDREMEADWAGTTFASNFNGGYYFIPRKYIAAVSEGWKKWAAWLYEKPALFDSPAQAIHTDQVAMSMAICEAQIEYENIASNFNCPTHAPNNQKYFDPLKPVALLHYHGAANTFGLLDKTMASNKTVELAVDKANTAIAERASFCFYEGYRKALVQPVLFTEKTSYVRSVLSALARKFDKKPRLILHAGTSKTGSTSLQFFLERRYYELMKSGYLYPRVYMNNTFDPKHQWIMRSLLTTDEEMWIENFRAAFFQMQDNTHTIILSTEGIHNHWNDFTQEAKSFLSVLSEVFEVQLWAWFREPVSYMHSFYRQNLKNPKNDVSCYGRDMSFFEMLSDEWFLKHLDYLGFIYDVEAIFKGNVSVFQFDGDIVSEVGKRFGLNTDTEVKTRENVGISGTGIDMLRIINRFPLDVREKEHVVYLLAQIEGILKNHPQPKGDISEAAAIINQTTALQKPVLTSKYGMKGW